MVREIDGDVWYVTGEVFEAWGTGARTAADYDIALTDKLGGMFVGTMDTNIGAGQYYIVTHQQAGGSPADTDPAVWQEYGDWSGTIWIPATITAGDVWDELVADHTGETTFGGEVGGLDPNLTLVLADSNELQTDWTDGGRLDLLIDAIKYKTDLLTLLDTTVKDANDANNFTLTAGPDANSVYTWHIIMVEDADDSHYELRYIVDWEYDTDVSVRVQSPFTFTPAAGDVVHVIGTDYEAMFWRSLIDGPIYRINYTPGAGGTQYPGLTQWEDDEDP
uniref:Uncharacterized protein n=1 Tax=viral metagenome TaxID=1070528 RepID=A0A6M3JCI9_9ZZZZ